MSSDSSSDNESNRSHSPTPAVASTPGHGLERSPGYDTKSQENSPEREGGRSSAGQSRRSRSSSRSSAASGRSGSHRSPSPALSNRSGSAASKRSGSGDSRRSGSVGSARSGSRSRSGSPASKRSGSPNSNRPTSAASKRSASADSHRSGSQVSKRSRAESQNSKRSGSPASRRSRSGSRRSGSATSNRSRSGSARSRSRSGSAVSKRSGSVTSRKSRSRSRSQDRSGSNSPNLQIDEPGSPASNKSVENEGKKKSRVLQSDSENEDGEGNAEKEGVSAAAIFGDDADDISEDSEEEKMKETSDKEDEGRRSRSGDEEDRKSDQENNEQQTVMDDEDDKENEPEPIPETRIDVEVPKISCDLGRDINFVKLPNFLSVETRPFDPETYEDEIDEEETLDEEGRARLKLKVENTIRWREAYDEEGNLKKESNARIVRWSDGSYSLHLGSEIFDVYRQPLQGDHNHLFIRQGTGLQGQAVFRTKLSFRPHSTESFTHRKMTLSLADRSQKTTGIKILSQVGVDPDHDKAERLKKEEEKLRQSARPKTTQRKKNDISRSHATSNIYREEEGSEDEGGISLNAIKNKYKAGAKGGAIYSSDEEGSDIEDRRSRKSEKAKALKDSDEESGSD